MKHVGSTGNTNAANDLAQRVRVHLCELPRTALPVTYQVLAKALNLSPPNTIHQLTEALERLTEEDASATQPLIAALVVSRARGGLPAPGFFDCARKVGFLEGMPSDAKDRDFYAAEFDRAVEYWSNIRNHSG